MQFIDTHIHLQDYKTKSAPQIIAGARAAGVEKFVCAAVTEEDWPEVAALAEAYPEVVVPAYGLHPWYAGQARPGWEKRLEAYLRRCPAALVGEAGLDRLHNSEIEPQLSVFGLRLSLPVLLNVRCWCMPSRRGNGCKRFGQSFRRSLLCTLLPVRRRLCPRLFLRAAMSLFHSRY